MAILIEGQSECVICKCKLQEFEDIIMFPPLISNINDRIYPFSDSGVHKKCLTRHPLAADVIHYREQYDQFNNKRPIIDVEGNIIENPREIISWGLLTSDPSEELHRYNFLTLNRKRIANWTERENFLMTAKRYVSDGKWKSYGDFNLLEYLINLVE
ncbi:hypothetical protein [Chitinophaga sp. S165]|uniref:hypothetical protein n=1 Tax=Chitinophaga sp. S165 TaxID=2135462 RepID=UPI000D70F558|nr:hypothetical protein [Chitinophaga sp. S165]PWV55755.1 hypothetical protein C7475_101262 [Chitinophaga sp. S165]